MRGNIVEHVRFLLRIGPVKHFGLNAVVGKESSRAACGVEFVALRLEHLRSLEQFNLRFRRTRRDEHSLVRRRNAVTDREHTLQQCLVVVVADAGRLARRSHIDTQNRVGFEQTRKRELRRFDTHIVDVGERLAVRLHLFAQHYLCGHSDEVEFGDFRHKRETSRRAQVALNHTQSVVFGQELDIERARDVQSLCYLFRNLFDTTDCLVVEFLRGEHHRGVARVDARILNVLADGVAFDDSVLRNCVNFNLFGALQELRHHHRVLVAHNGRITQGVLKFVAALNNTHCRTRQHIRRADEHRKAHLVNKAVDVVDGVQLFPAWLVDAERVTHCRELLTVFGHINRFCRSSQDVNTLTVKQQRKVVRNLSASRYNHAFGLFQLADVEHALQRQFVEEQAVADVVVSADGFRVVVYHYGAVAHLLNLLDSRNTAPVELNT